MKICYKEKKFHAASLKLIVLCNEIIEDWNSKGYSLTLRQLYYQLVSRDVIRNNDQSYDNVGAMLSDARLAGLIDWDAIVDRTRALKALPHWNDPSEIVRGAAKQFNYDLWKGQSTRVEVWVEKDAMSDIVSKACNPLDIPFFACKGYTSQSEMWGAAQRINNYQAGEDKCSSVVILHLGDHDPSGLDMTRDITERLALFCETDGYCAPIVKRVALNMDQIRKYNPPPNPTKLTDCRAQGYIAQYGHDSWELDALQPDVIVALIQKHARGFIDSELFDAEVARQKEARKELLAISDQYPEVVEHSKGVCSDVLETQTKELREDVATLKTENISINGTLDIRSRQLDECRAQQARYIKEAGTEIARLEKELKTATAQKGKKKNARR